MLQEIKTESNIISEGIRLSASAANAVREILTERKLEGYALRVYVSGGGCCGAQFGMALDNNIRENDMTFETDGVMVVVDDMSIDYLRGAKVDFVHDPARGTGFVVDSPVEMKGGSCACGSNSAENSEGGCGCGGGSCGCGGH